MREKRKKDGQTEREGEREIQADRVIQIYNEKTYIELIWSSPTPILKSRLTKEIP